MNFEKTELPQIKQMIMTSPVSFGVSSEIDHLMHDNVNTVHISKAVQQWSALRNILLELNIDVIVMPKPPKDCPNAVFTANAGLIYKDLFIPSRFKYSERQVEEPYFSNWFYGHNFEIIFNNSNIVFEGSGDALFNSTKKILWFGFGQRSSLAFKQTLDVCFSDTDVIVRPLELIDARLYHLNMCFCPLNNGMLLWYPYAFSEHSRYIIETWYGDKAITVSEEDALNFACNAISIDDKLVLPFISQDLEFKLIDVGIIPIQVDLSEFKKSGGSAKSLTLNVFE